MAIGNRNDTFEIPVYSLTGDILSFHNCSLQYRYYNGSSLPPSRPVQMWTGQLIHGVLEEAYKLWKENGVQFNSEWPCSYPDNNRTREYAESLEPNDIYRLGYNIEVMLAAGGIRARSYEARRYAYLRSWRAVNFIGPMLFPLIEFTEKKMSATRDYPRFNPPDGQTLRGDGRYELTGVADVISSNKISETLPAEATSFLTMLGINNEAAQYEILIDYKSMKRPSISDDSWRHHEDQVRTYSWLRSKQPDSFPVHSGLIVYVDELYLSKNEVEAIRTDLQNHDTDIVMDEGSQDYYQLRMWDGSSHFDFSKEYAIRRALRLIDVSPQEIDQSLNFINNTVREIESTVLNENQTGQIINNWDTHHADARTCVTCDFRHSCSHMDTHGQRLIAP